LVEWAAGPDFEVAQPNQINLIPYAPSAPQSNWEPRGCAVEGQVIGGAQVLPSLNHAQTCIGEKIVSIRTLLQYWFNLGVGTTGLNLSNSAGIIYVNPFMWNSATDSAHTISYSSTSTDNYARFTSCYALSRGTVKIHMRPTSAGITKCALIPYSNTTAASNTLSITAPSSGSMLMTGLPISVVDTSVTGVMSLQCPQYTYTHSRSVPSTQEGNIAFVVNSLVPQYLLKFVMPDSTGYADLYRSVGDDFSLGCFVGVPVCYSAAY
jgi:hypothetical protein